MPAFVQNFTITQSDDCTTLSIQDTSNFDDNDESYTYNTFTTKTITLYDQDNVALSPVITIVDDTPIDFTLDKDRFLTATYRLSNVDITLTPVTKTYALSCNVELKYGQYLVENSNKLGDTLELDSNSQPYFNVVKAIKAAEIFGSRSNGVKSQDCLDLANQYIDDLKNN